MREVKLLSKVSFSMTLDRKRPMSSVFRNSKERVNESIAPKMLLALAKLYIWEMVFLERRLRDMC